jgi:murein DD-endopeptidase MepM/ murein hydrolase activator NlpD
VHIQINLNLLAHAVGDDPAADLPAGGTLVPAETYAFGTGAGDRLNLQPFAFTGGPGGARQPRNLPLGDKLRAFLDEPLGGERMDLSLPFYDEAIRLGNQGGGWMRPKNNGRAFHAATDFMPSDGEPFEVCAAADGVIQAKAGGCVVLSHTTPGGREFRTVYVHMDLTTVAKVQGDPVRRGERLGRLDAATDPVHLHFGVAVQGPAFTFGGTPVPALWYFLDPWGVYDYRDGNYLPKTGAIFHARISGGVHTVQWRAQPVFKAIPIARKTAGYVLVERIQIRVRSSDNRLGTLPAEQDRVRVWLQGDGADFQVPLRRAKDPTAELELATLLREAFLHGRRVRLEYRFEGSVRFIMAAWVRR